MLIPGTTVYLEIHDNKARKTKYSLIAAQKGNTLINMDSQAPNQIWWEALSNANNIKLPCLGEITLIKREAVYGNSRLDFYVESYEGEGIQKSYMEVKGVTLESDSVAFFPDAPTERGIKHIHELIKAASSGYLAYIVFIIQMKGIKYFSLNDKMHPAFGNALREAPQKGVHVLSYDCHVTSNEIIIGDSVPIDLD